MTIAPFEFATANRVVFGAGVWREAAPLADTLGRRVLVVTGSTPSRAAPLLAALNELGLASAVFGVTGEPTTESVIRGLAAGRGHDCEVVIGIGGGSVLDAAKAIAVLLTNPGDLFDYLEVIGRGRAITQRGLPCLAIPTTAGTGAEVTANAVIASPPHGVKVSLRSRLLLPSAAFVDPELTHGLPRPLTATTGLDALTQLIEPYVSSRANPVTDPLCLEGLRRAARSLRRACDHPQDTDAREDMALASLLGGMALANAGLGAVHGFAGPIGGMCNAPHGAVCAALLPSAMAVNLRALHARQPGGEGLPRYGEVARLLTGRPQAAAEEGVAWVSGLCSDLGIPPLSAHGVGPNDLPALVEKGARASSMRANPIPLTAAEMHEVLQRAL